MRLSGISGKAYDGQLDGLVELKNTDGTGLFSAQLKLTGADLGTAFTATRFTGRGDMTASVSATGKSIEAMVAALTGSGTAALHGLTIAGLNPQAFQAIIARADEIGSDVDAVKIAAFAPSIAESRRIRRRRCGTRFHNRWGCAAGSAGVTRKSGGHADGRGRRRSQ